MLYYYPGESLVSCLNYIEQFIKIKMLNGNTK